MGEAPGTGATGDELAELRASLAVLRSAVEAQADELRVLRTATLGATSSKGGVGGDGPGGSVTVLEEPARIGRRSMLRKAGAVAAGTVAGVVLLDGKPAAAATVSGSATANNEAGVLGTTLWANGSGVYGLANVDTSVGTRGIHIGQGGTGVLGTAQGSSSVGVKGTATGSASIGVRGETTGTDGIAAGVQGVGGVFGVLGIGQDDTGLGVGGLGPDVGVYGSGSTTGVVAGSSRTQLSFGPAFLGSLPAPPRGANKARTKGEMVYDNQGDLWFCVATGNPGTWRRLAGPSVTGGMVPLTAPKRVYDSRPASKLAANTPRVVDCKANASGVPVGATGVLAVLMALEPSGTGNMSVWANGVPKENSQNIVWSGTNRASTLAFSRLDATAKCQVQASVATHFVLDIVAYYL